MFIIWREEKTEYKIDINNWKKNQDNFQKGYVE